MHKTLLAIGVSNFLWRQYVDGDGPIEADTFGTIDLSHAASTKLGDNLITDLNESQQFFQ